MRFHFIPIAFQIFYILKLNYSYSIGPIPSLVAH